MGLYIMDKQVFQMDTQKHRDFKEAHNNYYHIHISYTKCIVYRVVEFYFTIQIVLNLQTMKIIIILTCLALLFVKFLYLFPIYRVGHFLDQ